MLRMMVKPEMLSIILAQRFVMVTKLIAFVLYVRKQYSVEAVKDDLVHSIDLVVDCWYRVIKYYGVLLYSSFRTRVVYLQIRRGGQQYREEE